jgi:FtsP/CotA-like multicopper oxidase with cupredoxin domain
MRIFSLLLILVFTAAAFESAAQPTQPGMTRAFSAQKPSRAFTQPLDLMKPRGLESTLQPSECPAAAPVFLGNDIKLTLAMRYSDHFIHNPDTGQDDKVSLRTYYDCLAGPTLTVKPGNRLRMMLSNELPANDPARCPFVMNTPDCFNSANMHTHGLHVSPAGNSDNVLLSIDPGKSFPYEYNIPLNHPAGTFWYHSHRHGSTALTVSSGMEGVLIIKGERPYQDRAKNEGVADIDTILHDKNGRDFNDRIFLFQQISYGCFSDAAFNDLEVDPVTKKWVCKQAEGDKPAEIGVVENYHSQFSPQSWVSSGRYTGINGKVQPILQMRVGEIERWRLVHGGVRDTINLEVVRATSVPVASATPGAGGVALQSLVQFNAAGPASPQRYVAGLESLRGAELQAFTDQCNTSGVASTQFEIAEDGLTRRDITPKSVNTLNPGQRSDVLMFFSEPGLYCILDQSGAAENAIVRDRGGSKSRKLLATVIVTEGASITVPAADYLRDTLIQGNKSLPADQQQALAAFNIGAFAYFPPNDPSGDLSNVTVTGHPSALFDINFSPPDPVHADILGRIQNEAMGTDPLAYQHDVSYKAALGTVDEWTLGTWKNIPGQDVAAPHVFHIHVNPFQIMDIKHVTAANPAGTSIFDSQHRCLPAEATAVPYYCDQYHVFRDTLFVRPNYFVIARNRYDDYIGEYVMHCHILDHEDMGMMQNVTVDFPAIEHPTPPGTPPHH